MAGRTRILINVAWNWAGMVSEAAAAFLIMPFLVRRLGEANYGLWILIGSVSSYFGLLDLGIRASVGRFVAYHQAKGDRAGVNATVSAAMAALAGAGTIVLLSSFGVQRIFFRMFDVPTDQVETVRLAVLLVCANLALFFIANVFDATLWAFQRFDLLNMIDIPATFVRLGMTYYVIDRGYGLVGLATLTVVLTACVGLAKAWMSFRVDPGLRIRVSSISRGTIRELFGYGLSNFAITVARMTRAQMSPFLVGSLLGLRQVTPFSVAKRLFDYTQNVLVTGTGVLTPLAATLHAQGQHDRQRSMFLEGGRYCLTAALFFLIFFGLLGGPLITLWMGPLLARSWILLMILMAGELLPMTQFITINMLLGRAHHKPLAWLSGLEVIAGLGLVLVLYQRWGLFGVCAALAISGAVFRGVAVLYYGCRTMEVSLERYLVQTFLAPLALAVPPALGLAAAVAWAPPHSWARLLAYGGAYTMAYAVASLPLMGRARLASGRAALVRFLAPGRRGGPPAIVVSTPASAELP